MLVIDDLHWADTSSLRVLRLLTEAAVADGPGVGCSWSPPGASTRRPRARWPRSPRRSGASTRCGSSCAGSRRTRPPQVFRQVSETEPTEAETEALRRRTEGNPFFLVEYARLARERGDLAALMAEAQPPAAVHEVISRRLAQLGDDTRDLLQAAA